MNGKEPNLYFPCFVYFKEKLKIELCTFSLSSRICKLRRRKVPENSFARFFFRPEKSLGIVLKKFTDDKIQFTYNDHDITQ